MTPRAMGVILAEKFPPQDSAVSASKAGILSALLFMLHHLRKALPAAGREVATADSWRVFFLHLQLRILQNIAHFAITISVPESGHNWHPAIPGYDNYYLESSSSMFFFHPPKKHGIVVHLFTVRELSGWCGLFSFVSQRVTTGNGSLPHRRVVCCWLYYYTPCGTSCPRCSTHLPLFFLPWIMKCLPADEEELGH